MAQSRVIDEYFTHQRKYEQLYGERTITLMEVGSFYEYYGIDRGADGFEGRINEVADLCNMNIATTAYANNGAKMAGFPNYTFDKWSDILLKHGWTVVRIDQTKDNKGDTNRKVVEVLSPGTYIDSASVSNYTMSIVIEEVVYKGRNLFVTGVAILDASTGKNYVVETVSTPDDPRLALDDTLRLIQSYQPAEILIHTTLKNPDQLPAILKHLETEGRTGVLVDLFRNRPILSMTPRDRNEFLKKSFPACRYSAYSDPTEYIGLTQKHHALLAYIILLEFAYQHNETIIERLETPVHLNTEATLHLAADSIYQLNIIRPASSGRVGIRSLMDVLDRTRTALGRRKLADALIYPITDRSELNKRYDIIQHLRNIQSDWMMLSDNLKAISDIERLHRRMSFGRISPAQVITLLSSYERAVAIIGITSRHNIPITTPDITLNNFLQELIKALNRTYIVTLGNNETLYRDCIFKEGYSKTVDEAYSAVKKAWTSIDDIVTDMTKYLPASQKTSIEWSLNDRGDFSLTTTPSRGRFIKEAHDKGRLSYKGLDIKINSGSCRISGGIVDSLGDAYYKAVRRHTTECEAEFKRSVECWYKTYEKTMISVATYIATVDMMLSLAICSSEYGYCRPSFSDSEEPVLDITDLRHPIIERISQSTKYVANNVLFDAEHRGMLLYGVNAVGKSSYMKAVGMAIIMAQIGSWVPASAMAYTPYKSLYTRITGDDNIFKGHSTFAVEMLELRNILRRSDKWSLVLGDELCSGTETISGLAIVTAGICELARKKASFIFATHLHKLADMEEVKMERSVACWHMETRYDETTKTLIYDRHLREGSGSAVYGLEVARGMDMGAEFIENADRIRRRLTGVSEELYQVAKTSVYNTAVVVEKCSICDADAIDTHHISEQHKADANGMIGTFHKNAEFNLVQLCKSCHQAVHTPIDKQLIIEGWETTTSGRRIKFHWEPINNKKNNSPDYSETHMARIRELWRAHGKRATIIKLLNSEGINITDYKLKELIKNW